MLEVKPYWAAQNLWAVYLNGKVIYCNIYKCACEQKVKEFKERYKNFND